MPLRDYVKKLKLVDEIWFSSKNDPEDYKPVESLLSFPRIRPSIWLKSSAEIISLNLSSRVLKIFT